MRSWSEFLKEEQGKPYYKDLSAAILEERKNHQVFPSNDLVFNAFRKTPLDKTHVCILSQDPYHGKGQAHGLAFSVCDGVSLPPSLRNIYKELKSDLGIENTTGNLESWAEQGILLLNSSLTVREGQANSHSGLGWAEFTDAAIREVNAKEEPVVFVLWGGFARKKKALITGSHHLVLESAHPSPLSAHNGFFGSRPFSQINAFLETNGKEPIEWKLK